MSHISAFIEIKLAAFIARFTFSFTMHDYFEDQLNQTQNKES